MIKVEFTYTTKIGTELKGSLECLDFDEAMEALTKLIDWCDIDGFRMRKCDILDIPKEVVHEM